MKPQPCRLREQLRRLAHRTERCPQWETDHQTKLLLWRMPPSCGGNNASLGRGSPRPVAGAGVPAGPWNGGGTGEGAALGSGWGEAWDTLWGSARFFCSAACFHPRK